MSTTTAARFAANTSDRRQERNTGIQNPKRDRGFESGVLEVIRGGLGVLAHPSGTDGSNPVPSSGELGTNHWRVASETACRSNLIGYDATGRGGLNACE